ncbi:pkb-activating kinase-like protein [Serendipita sp. 399]|nr:pkb-activating kinase-like protein [Serendipita sp. 399]
MATLNMLLHSDIAQSFLHELRGCFDNFNPSSLRRTCHIERLRSAIVVLLQTFNEKLSTPKSRLMPNASSTQENLSAVGEHVLDADSEPDTAPPPPPRNRFLRFQPSSAPSTPSEIYARGRIEASNYEFGKILGEGAYSTVVFARRRSSVQTFAAKMIDKNHLVRNHKTFTALTEKNALVKLGKKHPGIVHLVSTFHDETTLYFILDLAANGELRDLISRLGSLSMECTRYYAAQIVDALDYMHSKGVIHRDLKPENLLLDDMFRLKITDFGTAKLVGDDQVEKWVGTAQYQPPELLTHSETTAASDLWALGCIVYEMIAGQFAFRGLSTYLIWQKIKAVEYDLPDGFEPAAADLVQRLLVVDPLARLGQGGKMAELRSHIFFNLVPWDAIWTIPHPPIEAGLVQNTSQSTGDGFEGWDLEVARSSGENKSNIRDLSFEMKKKFLGQKTRLHSQM